MTQSLREWRVEHGGGQIDNAIQVRGKVAIARAGTIQQQLESRVRLDTEAHVEGTARDLRHNAGDHCGWIEVCRLSCRARPFEGFAQTGERGHVVRVGIGIVRPCGGPQGHGRHAAFTEGRYGVLAQSAEQGFQCFDVLGMREHDHAFM